MQRQYTRYAQLSEDETAAGSQVHLITTLIFISKHSEGSLNYNAHMKSHKQVYNKENHKQKPNTGKPQNQGNKENHRIKYTETRKTTDSYKLAHKNTETRKITESNIGGSS